MLVVGGLVAVVLGALVARARRPRRSSREARAQRAADLGALAGARAMHDAYSRLFEPVIADASGPNARHLGKAEYLALGRAAAMRVARANGARRVRVAFPDGETFAPVRVARDGARRVRGPAGGARRAAPIEAVAEAELAPPGGARRRRAAATTARSPTGRASRCGRTSRCAFDRMERAARADGVALIITSGYRSDAEQAMLFARHPDPRWVAPPGHARCTGSARSSTSGRRRAYGWLAAQRASASTSSSATAGSRGTSGYTLNAESTAPARGHARRRAAAAGAARVRPGRLRAR